MSTQDEFTGLFGEWLVDTVSVEAYLGVGFDGELFGPPTPVLGCMVDKTRKLIRATDGTEVVSELAVFAPAGSPLSINDRVTVDGVPGKVIRVAEYRVEGLPQFTSANLA